MPAYPPFEIFAVDHLIALAIVAFFSAIAFRAAQSRWSKIWNTAGGVTFAVFAIALWGFRLKDGFQAPMDLPLFLCDIAFIMCVACFIVPNEIMLTLVTYWGLAGTLQALITPDLLSGFPSPEYFLFFIGHAIIVVGVFFLLGKTRPARLPTRYGVGVAFAGLLVYTAVVGLLDACFGWNYGYLRHKPDGASILDAFGPWPIYILGALALALFLFTILAGLLRFLWKSSSGEDTP